MSAPEKRRGRIRELIPKLETNEGKEPAVMAGQMPVMRVTMLAKREIAL
jgi:hypothetical protein